jgi:glycosyltransferase involved in cell wall biosynthesis
MTDEPRVSIVVPTYNGRRFIERSIRSCLAQTYRSIELIVVDDASTDSTNAIVSELAKEDHRIQVIRHERNRKLPAALNTGFSRAKGELWTWTSDDNWFRPEAIEAMAGFLMDNPRADMVYTPYTLVDEEGQVLREARVEEPRRLVEGNCVGACFLYRRRLAEAVGDYREELFLAEDYDFWLRASVRGQMVPWDRNLYFYRIHAASLTQTHGQGSRIGDRALARNLPKLSWLTPRQKGEVFLQLSRRARWRGQRGAVMAYFSRAGWYAPGACLRHLCGRFWRFLRPVAL